MGKETKTTTQILGFGGSKLHIKLDIIVPCNVGEFFGLEDGNDYEIYEISWQVVDNKLIKTVLLDDR